MVIPSVFLRSVLAVLIAIVLSLISGMANLPAALSNIVSWTLVFTIPCVGFAMWVALLYWRLRHAGIHELLAPGRGHLPLMYVSLAGYALATVVSAIGVLAFPEAFP